QNAVAVVRDAVGRVRARSVVQAVEIDPADVLSPEPSDDPEVLDLGARTVLARGLGVHPADVLAPGVLMIVARGIDVLARKDPPREDGESRQEDGSEPAAGPSMCRCGSHVVSF